MAPPSLFLHDGALPGLWDLISWISRNPRRQKARPSLCPLEGCPPSDPQLLQVNSSLNSVQGHGRNIVVWGWEELEDWQDEAQGLGGPFVYLIRQEILEWVAIYVWVRQKKEGVKEERRKRQEGISLH